MAAGLIVVQTESGRLERYNLLGYVAALPHAPFCVGFAAESHDVERYAEEKRRRKRLPLLIANRAQDALGSDANEVILLDDAGAGPGVAGRRLPGRRRVPAGDR